uniref:Cation efflux protein cytoplasmic domain-containing protein n=1 Tax=Peronospora matthiolae TaxID=2874970 RepID=A0AAV1U7I8_9STRA
MWRAPGSVFNPFCTASRYHFVPLRRHVSTKQRPLQWQEVRLIKHLSSESSSRSQNGRDEVQTLFLSQGKEAIKITRLGMYVNVAMAATKGAVGVAIHSSALIADAAHSLSDLLSDVVTLWSVKVARLPPDQKHPYGYGKYEAVGSLSVGAILVLCGIGIGADGLQAMQQIWNGEIATTLPDLNLLYLSDMDRSTQWALAAGAAGLSIAAKEALFRVTVKIGQQAKSKVLIANAWHHRTDAISSVVALGGIIGSMAGMPLLDPVAGMAVAAMIVKTGGEICLDSVQELTDNTVETEVLETLKEVSGSVEDVLHVSQVRARRMGPYTLVDLRVHLDARTSISMAQQISKQVRSHILKEVPDVSEVLVHLDVQFDQLGYSNRGSGDLTSKKDLRPYREIKNDISYALATIPEITGTTHINTHWIPHQGTVVDVAIVVQPDLKVEAAHAVAKRARKSIEGIPYIVEADIHLELQDDESDSV